MDPEGLPGRISQRTAWQRVLSNDKRERLGLSRFVSDDLRGLQDGTLTAMGQRLISVPYRHGKPGPPVPPEQDSGGSWDRR